MYPAEWEVVVAYFKVIPGHFLEKLRETTNNIRVSGDLAEIQTVYLMDASLQHYRYANLLGVILLAVNATNALLTNSTELSPSWEADDCSSTPQPLSILWKQKVHSRVHKSLTLVCILDR
jgi:hypothetical protein